MYIFAAYLICFVIGKDLAAGDVIKICSEESTNEKNPVVWPSSFGNDNKLVSSRPLCLSETQELITRTCTKEGWSPRRDEVPDCFSIQSRASIEQCPPGYSSIINQYGKINFCYQLTNGTSWDYPCFHSGSSLTIFDLEFEDMEELLNKLNFEDRKLVWLPAKRSIPYGPLVWTLPGEKWGESVEIGDNYITRLPVVHSCLLAELGKYSVKTENCSFVYPALCLFEKNHLLTLHCPRGYKAGKYGHNDGMCYGLEIQDEGAPWQEFKTSSCSEPLQILSKVENYLVGELAEVYNYKMRNLCWTGLMQTEHKYYWYPNTTVTYVNWDPRTLFNNASNAKGVLSRESRWLLKDENSSLSCMACQMRVDFKSAEITLQVTSDSDIIHLVIYNPNTLWKEKTDDPGVSCFTNAGGFVRKVEIEDEPYRMVKLRFQQLLMDEENLTKNFHVYSEMYTSFMSRFITYSNNSRSYDVEKVVFEIYRINDESGEYWCEGHNSHNFSSVQSSKITVASKKTERHDFVLKVKIFNICSDISTCKPDWDEEAEDIEKILNIKSAKFMKIENFDSAYSLEATLHINVMLIDSYNCVSKQCKITKTYQVLLSVSQAIFARSEKYDLIHIKSTEFCLPFDEDDACPLHWGLTPIGGNVAPEEFCMQSNGLPVTRKCKGNFLEGATWGPVDGRCSENYEPTNRTTFLYRLAKGWEGLSTASMFLTHDLITILDDKADLIPADIYFLAMSLKTIVEISDYNGSLIELGDSSNLANAINSIMDIDANFLNLAQTMNSSNILLESVDIILSKIALNDTFVETEDSGIDIAVTPQFLTHISSPYINNISGVALARRSDANSSLFTDLDVISLTTNMSLFEILAIPNLEIATWLTQDLIDSIKFVNRTNETLDIIVQPKILIQAFYSDVIFQETKTERDIINSRVISVSVPGYESDLPLPLIMIYRRLNKNVSSERACAFWDFGNSPHSEGQWSKKGCYHLASHDDLDVCACLHLTHFAQLVIGSHGSGENGGGVIILYYHGRALNAITMVGCSLSLVGVAGIAATALVFPAWRQKAGSKVLLQLSAALGLQSIMMLSQDGLHNTDTECIALGALLHYSVLAAFMWMLLTALLQFARYVRVLGVQRPVRFMLKFSLAGWGLPILPVAILLIIDPRAYLPPPTFIPVSDTNSSNLIRDPSALCYPQGLNLYLTVLLPVVCIVITNLTVFVLVMRSILRGPDGKRRSVDPELVISQLRLSVLLFFLLGLSWIFGLLAATGGQIVFSYLFCLTATLQGFVLFIYFIVCDPATRVLWVSLVRERSRTSNNSTREISSVNK